MAKRGKVFQTIGTPSRGMNAFNLSHEKKLTCDFGQLIPIAYLECSPGDVHKISLSLTARFQPLVHPIFHEVTISTHWFFCPTRTIWGNNVKLNTEDKMEQPNRWERFISKGKSGNDATALPLWVPTTNMKYKIWDYIGLPLTNGLQVSNFNNSSYLPIDFAKRVYNFIYQEYYRDENLQESWLQKMPKDSSGAVIYPDGQGDEFALNENILNRNWTKDYFTSARPWQQKGTSPSFPIAGSAELDWTGVTFPASRIISSINRDQANTYNIDSPNIPMVKFGATTSGPTTQISPGVWTSNKSPTNAPDNYGWLNSSPPMASADTFLFTPKLPMDNPNYAFSPNPKLDMSKMTLNADMNDLRTGIQIQKWLERNARGGTRYTELLRAHFGVSPSDSRLQRPEYIGGSKQPMIISEVLQTSESGSTSAQGNMAGHGISADVTKIGSYRSQEYGYIMGIMSIMPKPAYQNGINRIHLRRTPWDFYWQEFANLSEREILNAEIAFSGNDEKDGEVLGFQGQYDELRITPDMVVADMRDDFKEWVLSRIFDQNNPPNLNSQFIQCDSQTGGANNQLKRIFAVPSERGIVVNVANIITKLAHMPINPEPGLMDHF